MIPQFTRRAFIGAALAATGTAALMPYAAASGVDRIMATDPLVARYEARRPANGTTVTQRLSAGSLDTMIAGVALTTWGYNDSLNGPLIRAKTGDLLRVPVINTLSDPTTIHWHGVSMRNDGDGVPGLTQTPIGASASFEYEFLLNRPGTYWYHSHSEMQRERAMSGALIIDDPREPMEYDQEWIVILDDWLDGLPGTPEDALSTLTRGMGGMGGMMAGMGSRFTSSYLGGDAGDLSFPAHLFNGRAEPDVEIFRSQPGNRIRLRIINASGDTAYRVGVPGQKITLTHSDGFPVAHQDVDAVVLGMGERIDALISVTDGFTPLLALPEGKKGSAYGLISTGTGIAPSLRDLPTSIRGTITDGGQLEADDSARLPVRRPDSRHMMRLTGGMHSYNWGINGRAFDMEDPFAGAFDIRVNDRVRVKVVNDTMMWHPMHLHGHSFQLAGDRARKDTVIVRPHRTVTFDFDADNPGQWLAHCHNAYHAARGMIGMFSYIR